jgi:hypothetical protein
MVSCFTSLFLLASVGEMNVPKHEVECILRHCVLDEWYGDATRCVQVDSIDTTVVVAAEDCSRVVIYINVPF